MRSGSSVYPQQNKSKENLSLKRTLSALDYERCLKMRELEIKRRQFMCEHRKMASRHNVRNKDNFRETIHDRIEKKKEEERQSTLVLQNRSTDFIQELKVKPLSTLIKMERKPSPLEIQPPITETPKQPLNSRVTALYQKGFAGVLHQEKRVNPFVQSVNAILEKLKVPEEGEGTKDPMNSFTRNILCKYAGLKTGNTETISEESKNTSVIVPSISTTPPNGGEETGGVEKVTQSLSEEIVEKEADTYLKSAKHSSKGLQLWARVRKEQKESKREHLLRENADMKQENEAGKKQAKPTQSVNVSKPRPYPRDKSAKNRENAPARTFQTDVSDSMSVDMKSVKSNSARSSTSSRINRNPSPNTRPAKQTRTPKENNKNHKGIKTESVNTRSSTSQVCPLLAVEDCTGESKPQTLIIIHDENDNDTPHPSIQWDQSHRYSASDIDIDVKHLLDNIENPQETDDSSQNASFDDKTSENSGKSDDANSADGDNEIRIDIISPEPFLNREEMQPSVLSTYTGSELTSLTRSQSRQGGKRSRCLSVQTSGALRMLTSVLNEESKQDEKRQDDASLTEMVNALAGVANDVEEQARRLDNIRRCGLTLVARDNSSTAGSNSLVNRRQMRRNSSVAPDKKNSAFVTNEVYKFLERRTSSKTTGRRQTLSKLELRLLSQAPGEDFVGRRNSVSHANETRKSTLEMTPSPSSIKGSNNYCSMVDKSSNFLDVLDRPKTPRRHSTGGLSEGLSTRPQSVSQLSHISENESAVSGKMGKTERSYNWAPDSSQTTDWHVLAMELLAKNRVGFSNFRTVTHMLQWLGEEYRNQTSSMMYEELRYCSYLRLAPHQVPNTLKDDKVSRVFHTEEE